MRALPARVGDVWANAVAFVALGLALALYYFPSGLPPSLIGAALFGGLCYWWPQWGTIWALFCSPLYRFPRAFDPSALGLSFLGRAEELRFSLFSWYVFPTDLQIAAAYGLDRFEIVQDNERTEYGKEWRWYLTLLFSFL